MNQHFADVKNLVNDGDFSDSFAKHFASHFKNDDGKLGTNPEELIASALVGCFNMKLSFVLNEANFNPDQLDTEAILNFEDGMVISIDLDL